MLGLNSASIYFSALDNYFLTAAALAMQGMTCIGSLQSLFVLRYVGTENMSNGFAVIQVNFTA